MEKDLSVTLSSHIKLSFLKYEISLSLFSSNKEEIV
jgi:hypothetical protein